MKVILIEDELLAAEDLSNILFRFPYNIEVVKILSSVSEAVNYFKQPVTCDLIFCDIQLGDGFCFDIFKQTKIDIPVIFCTAYNEYALEAFKNNGIAYILKPFVKDSVKEALEKYKNLQLRLVNASDYTLVQRNLQVDISHEKKASSILVNWKDKIIPVKIKDIALFTLEFRMTQLITFDNQKYFLNQNLDELEVICGEGFYRANRQYLVNRAIVVEAVQFSARKLLVKVNIEGAHEIIISKGRVPEFLSWLRS